MKFLLLFVTITFVFCQQSRRSLKFLNQKFLQKIDSNPYFYHHVLRQKYEAQKMNLSKSGRCIVDGPYCPMINGKNLHDNVIYHPDLVKVRKEVEFHIFSIVKDMETRAEQTDNIIYYYTDKSRQAIDNILYYQLPQVPF